MIKKNSFFPLKQGKRTKYRSKQGIIKLFVFTYLIGKCIQMDKIIGRDDMQAYKNPPKLNWLGQVPPPNCTQLSFGELRGA